MWIHPAVKKEGEYWESWFAWYPVLTELSNGQGAYAWLHEVERRKHYGYGGWQWRYREKLS